MNNLFKSISSKIFNFRQTIINPIIFQRLNNSTVTEGHIKKVMEQTFPNANKILVQDTSGGCGAMFNLYIENKDFEGISTLQQHRKVYDALKDEMKMLHGLHLETGVPSKK